MNAVADDLLKGSRTLRRCVYFSLVAITTVAAMGLLISVFQTNGITPLEMVMLFLYALLFSWICSSFWTAAIGFFICLSGRDRCAISATASHPPAPASGRTAVVMPIYNEDPHRVFAGLRAIYQSLAETGRHDQFDLFVLSDTRDPDIWIEEELRWSRLCRELNAQGRLFYRNRPKNTSRKSGNIADFCRQWGGRYRYMIVLDADSVMAGSTLVKMVELMDRSPDVALIQVPPVPVNHESLFARILQFASRLYGRMFTAGLNFWQLGTSNYWGHNAIVRIEPFVTHCALPALPGREPLGGDILSHDFVEAALLRRAGWKVWLAYDLGESYEELPPTLIDYAKRDRRWCQGNLQHLKMIFARGLRPISRTHMLMGIMSYVASPLWLLFLVVTGIEAYIQSRTEPVYFFGDDLFPVWPVSYAVEMMTVLLVTLAILFLPKLLGLILLFGQPRERAGYGGGIRAMLSAILESLFSVLLAPILMLFQSKFVLAILSRRSIGWPAQQRDDHQTGLREAVATHGGHTVLGLAAGWISYQYVPNFFWWFTPVLLGMVVSIPLSMLSSSVDLGRAAKKLGLFLTPEETNPPRVLQLLHHHLQQDEFPRAYPVRGSLAAITEPGTHALHLSLLPGGYHSRRHRHYMQGLILHFLEDGPQSMSAAELRELLSDQETLARLHFMVSAESASIT